MFANKFYLFLLVLCTCSLSSCQPKRGRPTNRNYPTRGHHHNSMLTRMRTTLESNFFGSGSARAFIDAANHLYDREIDPSEPEFLISQPIGSLSTNSRDVYYIATVFDHDGYRYYIFSIVHFWTNRRGQLPQLPTASNGNEWENNGNPDSTVDCPGPSGSFVAAAAAAAATASGNSCERSSYASIRFDLNPDLNKGSKVRELVREANRKDIRGRNALETTDEFLIQNREQFWDNIDYMLEEPSSEGYPVPLSPADRRVIENIHREALRRSGRTLQTGVLGAVNYFFERIPLSSINFNILRPDDQIGNNEVGNIGYLSPGFGTGSVPITNAELSGARANTLQEEADNESEDPLSSLSSLSTEELNGAVAAVGNLVFQDADNAEITDEDAEDIESRGEEASVTLTSDADNYEAVYAQPQYVQRRSDQAPVMTNPTDNANPTENSNVPQNVSEGQTYRFVVPTPSLLTLPPVNDPFQDDTEAEQAAARIFPNDLDSNRNF